MTLYIALRDVPFGRHASYVRSAYGEIVYIVLGVGAGVVMGYSFHMLCRRNTGMLKCTAGKCQSSSLGQST